MRARGWIWLGALIACTGPQTAAPPAPEPTRAQHAKESAAPMSAAGEPAPQSEANRPRSRLEGAGLPIHPGMLPVADLDEKPSTDWSWLLLELRPAIDKCLSHTSGSAPHVLRAWAMDLGRVGMYTSNDEAQLFHCTAPAFGSEIDDIKRLPQRAPGPTRLRPLFRPPGRTPGRLCGERVLDDEGDLVGFLVYGACQNRRR